jgi:hypothetical protein
VPTLPCFITKDLGTLSRDDVEDCVPFKWVRFLRLRAMDQSTGPERRVLKYSVIQSPDYLIYLQRRKKKRETTGVGYTRAEAQARQPVGYGVKKIDTGLEKSDD